MISALKSYITITRPLMLHVTTINFKYTLTIVYAIMAGYGSASIPTDSHSESSMSEILLAPLNELQSLAQALFASLSATQTKPPPAPPLSAFLNVDVALASAVKQARAHQVQQRKIERLKTEFLALETQWRDIVMELEQGKRDLSTIVEEGKERVKAIEDAKAGASLVLLLLTVLLY